MGKTYTKIKGSESLKRSHASLYAKSARKHGFGAKVKTGKSYFAVATTKKITRKHK